MSIVVCPQCGKRVSSLAPICIHCGFKRGKATEQDLQVMLQRKARDRVYHLKMISYAVMALLLAGFGWYWWSSAGFTQRSAPGPFVLMAMSALGYLVIRALLFLARRKLRELHRAAR